MISQDAVLGPFQYPLNDLKNFKAFWNLYSKLYDYTAIWQTSRKTIQFQNDINTEASCIYASLIGHHWF